MTRKVWKLRLRIWVLNRMINGDSAQVMASWFSERARLRDELRDITTRRGGRLTN